MLIAAHRQHQEKRKKQKSYEKYTFLKIIRIKQKKTELCLLFPMFSIRKQLKNNDNQLKIYTEKYQNQRKYTDLRFATVENN